MMHHFRTRFKKSFYIATLLMFGLSLLAPLAPAYAEGDPPADPAPVSEEADGGSEDVGEEAAPAEGGDEEAAEAEGDAQSEEASEADSGGGEAEEASSDEVEAAPAEEEAAPAESGEAAAEGDGSLLEEVVEAVLDPYFTVSGTLYSFFTAGGCTGILTPCIESATPIQSALDYLSGTLNATPDDKTVYVEDGTYTESVAINGNDWGGGATTPTELYLQSENGSGTTTITDSVSISNMMTFGLTGFTIDGGVTAGGNDGTLSLTDVVVNGTAGTGIDVTSHTGEVVLDKVDSSDNTGGNGASITANGSITVKNSNFNNNTDGTGGNQIGNGLFARLTAIGGMIDVSGVTANNNEESGALLGYGPADVTNAINVSNSTFKDNGLYGVEAYPETGVVTFKCLHTSGNLSGATLVPIFETTLWKGCEKHKEHEDGDKEFKVKLSTEFPKIVNAGNGIVVTFPPIEIIDEEKDPFGVVRPLKENQLGKDIAEDEIFGAAVDIQIINATIPEGSSIQIDFHIPGWLWGSETLHVYWCNPETGQWEELSFDEIPKPVIGGGVLRVNTTMTGIFVATRDAPPPTE